jgi:UDP-2,3-diacylglucosamine hydrolase
LMATDLDTEACRALLNHAGATTMIHGHTHRPAEHDLGDGFQRVVLSDWDLDAAPARGDVIRLSANGLQRLPL